MNSDNESLHLFRSGNHVTSSPGSTVKAEHRNVRDFDSLNNLMLAESDTESFNNGCKNDMKADDRDSDSESILTRTSTENQCQCLDTNSNSITTKLMFKAELDRHKSLIKRGLKDGSREPDTKYKLNSKKSIWRSFISLCVGLMFAFISFMPLRNIQTSLYPMKDLGNISLACMYFSFAIGCLCSTCITQNSRPKSIILVAMFGHVMYTAANIYPSMYSLIPVSCFFGFFHAPLWSAQEVIIASYGASYSTITRIEIDKAIQQFQGVFLVFCHAAQVFGNLLESAILHCGDYNNKPMNVSLYEADYYSGPIHINNITETETKAKRLVWIGPFGYQVEPDVSFPTDKTNYENVVKFVMLAFAVVGMTVICLFLNKPDIIVNKKKLVLCEKLKDVGRFLPTGTFFSLFLLMLFSGMQQAVVIGNVTKLYGSETVGISMVGYMMMCYGTCQLIVLLIMEKLQTRLKPSVAIFNAFLITLGLLVWLYIWEPTEEQIFKILGYVALWGAVDGLWQSQVQNVLLAWSIGKKEAAVTTFRTVQSLGLVLVFVLDIYMPLLSLVCICGAILVLGVISYLVLEVIRTPLTSLDPPPFAL
ncbi:Protein unc-93 A [Mactra antiquata]